MTTRTDQRENIATALKTLESGPLADAGLQLFAALGYKSDRSIPIATPKQFCEQLDPQGRLTDRERESLHQIKSLHLLFQISDAELAAHTDMFDDASAVRATKIESYLFFAAELPVGQYTRTALSALVRAINKPLPMPALVLFRHGDTVSLGIIHRRLHKRDQARDVLEKITLIKDISFADPIRAHLEILNDFVLENLDADFSVSNFVGLHEAWQKRLGSYALSNDFYREIADWYFWAHHQVEDGTIRLPQHCDTEQEKSLFLIRLLTRVIFCWFLVEKRLIPSDLFRENRLKSLLKEFNPGKDPRKPDGASTYYHAVLQNLFFGTLNMPPTQRAFREKKKAGERYDKNYGITNLWRYESDFRDPANWLTISARVPFLNGGLFDCLDDKVGKQEDNFILDGFSDNPKLTCHLPNDLFFGTERTVDLSHDYGEESKRTARSKTAKVRGLIEILSRYKFTIEENTPLEEEIALDPELLGKVFENLLASFNEDTQTTARKALGAFYTPREIVSYMVDEALKSYLGSQVPRCKGALADLFSNKATLHEIRHETREALIAAIGRVKILDPACGSGAFPMGALHRLVDLLQKLDPNNESWKRDRLAEARRHRQDLEEAHAAKEELAACDARIADIEKSFDTRFHDLDFARKLYLIENSIYGVDIQPIATQIAKLRFFISLIVDQKIDARAENLGVRPLPNLETRLVAADTLIPIEKEESDLFSSEIDKLRDELGTIRHEHFNARSPVAKRKWREADETKRRAIAELLETNHSLTHNTARKLAAWDPYDQNSFAPFFDSEWMFGISAGKEYTGRQGPVAGLRNRTIADGASDEGSITRSTLPQIDSGFDIVIGNPPYVRQEKIKHLKPLLQPNYPNTYTGTADLYVYFYDRALQLLRAGGTLSFITSNKWYRVAYGEKLRVHLSRNARLLHAIDFGDAPVFTAIAYPTILIAIKGAPISTHTFQALNWDPETPNAELGNFGRFYESRATTCSQASLGAGSWKFADTKRDAILERMREAGTPLREFVNSRVFRGITTGLNEAFVVDEPVRKALVTSDKSSSVALKRYVRGRDIERWIAAPGDAWLIFTRGDFDLKKQPAIRKHLEKFRDRLMPGTNGGRKPGSYQWYEIQDNIAYWQQFELPKIVSTKVSIRPTFAFDESGAYLANTAYFFPVRSSALYLLALLNSSVSYAYCKRVFVEKQGGWYEVQPQGLEAFPVPNIGPKDQALMERLVAWVMLITRHFASNPTVRTTRDPLMQAYWERVLNGLVYELYFPDEVHRAGLRLFELVEQSRLSDIETVAEPARLKALRTKFEELYDGTHPLRIALDKLQTLDAVRIIEGKS